MLDQKSEGRRLFLTGAALMPVALLGATAPATEGSPPQANKRTSDPGPPEYTHPGYSPTFFSDAEWAFVCAACDRLVPHDETGPGALELGVPEYIDRTLQTPYGEGSRWYMSGPFQKAEPEFGYQSKLTPREQYRLGIRGVNDYTQRTFGKPFADLAVADRDTVLKQIEDGTAKGGETDLKSFFTGFLLKNTMEGYFGDPMYGGNKNMGAWKMIGYPGVRADYLEWVQRPQRYPYGPVDLHGRDA